MRVALLALALSVALPAAAQDLDLDLDAPAPAAAPKKAAKKGKSQPAKTAAPADELSLDLDAPAPAAKKPAASTGLDLDLDAPAPAPAPAPAKPTPTKPGAKATPTKPAPKNVDLELDLDLDAPAAKPRESASDDLELDLDDPSPTPKKPAPSPAKPQSPNVPAQKPATPPPGPGPQDPPPSGNEGDESGFEDSFYEEEFHYLDLGLKAGGLFLGRAGDATIGANGVTTAGRGLTIPVAFEIRVHPTDVVPGLGLAFEAGFFPKSGAVTRSLAQDPDFAQASSTWSMVAIPLSVGLSYDIGITEGISIGVRAAGLAQYVRSSTSWTSGGATVSGATSSAFALGWLAGAEAAFKAGPGAVVVDARIAQALTDLGMKDAYAQQGVQAEQPWNRAAPGNVQGLNVLVGYRLAL